MYCPISPTTGFDANFRSEFIWLQHVGTKKFMIFLNFDILVDFVAGLSFVILAVFSVKSQGHVFRRAVHGRHLCVALPKSLLCCVHAHIYIVIEHFLYLTNFFNPFFVFIILKTVKSPQFTCKLSQIIFLNQRILYQSYEMTNQFVVWHDC